MSQGRYMRRELAHLRAEESGLRAWLRLSPPLMPLGGFLLLPVRQRPDPERPRRDLLRLAAAHRRGCAVAHGPRGKAARKGGQPALRKMPD